jgi:hypothetical protein
LECVELFQCIREYRLKAEFTLVLVIDTLGYRKRVEPVIELLLASALSRSLRFMPLWNKADRLLKSELPSAGGPCRDTQKDGATNVGLHPMLCVQLKSCFALLNTVTGPARSMRRGALSFRGHTGLRILAAL